MLSVVAQVFALIIFIYLCAGDDLPPSSSDVEEGWQWEIQTDEGWLPTGTHWCRLSEETHTLLGQRVCAYRER